MLKTIVKDLMIPLESYPHVTYEDSLLQAMKTIEENWIEIGNQKTLPFVILVFGKTNNLVGMASLNNILRGLEPNYLIKRSLIEKLLREERSPEQAEIQLKRAIRRIMEHSERRIGEVMFPIEATIEYNEHIFKAFNVVSECKISLIPVINEGKVVGVVRSVDIFHEISEMLLKDEYIW